MIMNFRDKKVIAMIKRTIVHLMVLCYAILVVVAISSLAEASNDNRDTFCLAQNIYFEAGNQPLAGKIAVAQVVLNRVENVNYPDNICDVVYQAKLEKNWKGNIMPVRHMCQFSWYCDGKSDNPVDGITWAKSLSLARDTILNQDVLTDLTEGATHYHADSVHPYWADSLNQTVQINNHIFYK